jgi:hypothetical protein
MVSVALRLVHERQDEIRRAWEWRVESVQHLTGESFEAGSDHAMVSAKLDLC